MKPPRKKIRTNAKGTKLLAVWVSNELAQALNEAALRHDLTKSQIIRRAIKESICN
jgi:predicted transcriptional regulator